MEGVLLTKTPLSPRVVTLILQTISKYEKEVQEARLGSYWHPLYHGGSDRSRCYKVARDNRYFDRDCLIAPHNFPVNSGTSVNRSPTRPISAT